MFKKLLNKIKYKLTFYISIIIVVNFILLGIIFIGRYNNLLDQQIKKRILIPYTLLNSHAISFEDATNAVNLAKIIGVKPDDAYIIGKNNIIYYSINQSLLNLKLEQTDDYNVVMPHVENSYKPVINKHIIKGKPYLFSILPILNDQKIINGYLIIKVKTTSILKSKIKILIFYILGAIILLIVSIIGIIYLLDKILLNRTNQITNIINKLKDGDLDINIQIIDKNDECGQIEAGLQELVYDLNKKATFASEIEKGNFDFNYILESKNDKLGEALIAMRDSLKHAAIEDEKRKAEDSIRNWSTIGIAKFSDILRQHFTDLNELSFTIIKELVIYLNANQASIFLIDTEKENNNVLELTAAYAFDRRKYLKKEILIGEGLVGACAFEKQTIYLTEVPDSYVDITSGLGQANPNVLLIVPLLREDEVLGVIEIASFNKFEKYQIEFIEKVCENIASTLYNVRISSKTSILLAQL